MNRQQGACQHDYERANTACQQTEEEQMNRQQGACQYDLRACQHECMLAD